MNRLTEISRVVLVVFVVSTGVMHFVQPEPFVRIVPSYLPYSLALVYISGFFEILGGVGLLVAPVRRAAAWGLVALFIAVFPANINMAVNQIQFDGLAISPILVWARLPLQAVLIAWAWVYTSAPKLK